MNIYKTCKNGHDLTIEANVYVRPSNGRRSCRICKAEYDRQYRINNPEKIRETHRQYARQYRINNPEKVRELSRQWYSNNIERSAETKRQYRINNPEKLRQYRINNPEQAAVTRHRRRARKRNQMGHWSMSDSEFIKGLVDTHPNCHYCHNPLNGNHHIEHMTPLARGGLHAPENLTLACPPCNLHKGTMTAEEFMKSP